MPRMVDTTEYLNTVCALLRSGKQAISVPVAGISMCPFLHPEDTVFLETVEEKLKIGKIYLFVRPNGQYVLHRLIQVEKDGVLWMLGDNQCVPEPVCGREMLRAQVCSVRRKGKLCAPGSFIWWFYACPWRWLRRLRRPISGLWGKQRR